MIDKVYSHPNGSRADNFARGWWAARKGWFHWKGPPTWCLAICHYIYSLPDQDINTPALYFLTKAQAELDSCIKEEGRMMAVLAVAALSSDKDTARYAKAALDDLETARNTLSP